MLSNHHTHSYFSDGKNHPREYIEQAIEKGFNLIGFTEHSPLPFENGFSFKPERKQEYHDLMSGLKQKYAGQIAVYSGMEMDFVPGMSDNFAAIEKEYQTDYLIGSVHLVNSPVGDELWFIDGPMAEIYDAGLRDYFGGDIRKAVTAYYRQVNLMLETQRFDIIGHLDKIKMHNRGRYFSEDEKWYRDLVSETLRLIKEKDIIAEVNTRGIYKKRSDTIYPGIEILKQIKSLGIKVMVNSDAHQPEEIDGAYLYAFRLLEAAGIDETAFFSGTNCEFTSIPLVFTPFTARGR
jgi:histidinol-phosphatase (PHP family)